MTGRCVTDADIDSFDAQAHALGVVDGNVVGVRDLVGAVQQLVRAEAQVRNRHAALTAQATLVGTIVGGLIETESWQIRWTEMD